MKNIHVLPTDKPSRIYLIKSNNKLGITSNNPEFTENFGSGTQNQNIYITSDEEIKKGDWFIAKNKALRCTQVTSTIIASNTSNGAAFSYSQSKKIILTTDQDLIKDGVQAIDDEFLEWFVKNPSCEYVTVYDGLFGEDRIWKKYIIIPKEEPKQETLEEAVNNFKKTDVYINEIKQEQERSYSEEDLEYAFEQGKLNSNICYKRTFKNVLEILQFKNKQHEKIIIISYYISSYVLFI